jgi:hypothetical protein
MLHRLRAAIEPDGQYHVIISTASRPARTAGSASASCRDRSSVDGAE